MSLSSPSLVAAPATLASVNLETLMAQQDFTTTVNEAAALNDESEFELDSLELSLVAGGTGDISLGDRMK